jgi:hypothetical protein
MGNGAFFIYNTKTAPAYRLPVGRQGRQVSAEPKSGHRPLFVATLS